MIHQHQHLRQVKMYYLFVFNSSFGVCIYLQYFFDIERKQTSNKVTRFNQKLMQRICRVSVP